MALELEKLNKIERRDGTTITYGVKGTPFLIQSRKRHIPHAAGRSGTWDHTTFVVMCRGFDVKEFQTLKDAKEWIEGGQK